MSNDNDMSELINSLTQAIPVLEESNKHARKKNRLAEKQYRQSILNYEQVERQYLIEKSHLQPAFRVTVNEFLTCEPDFVNDPEQASEAKFLLDHGIGQDQRVLRIKLSVKGDAQYMQPNIIIPKVNEAEADERIMSMTELLYFVAVDEIAEYKSGAGLNAYLVYRDKTTLPVVHMYQLTQRHDSALLRWDVSHLDTVFVSTHKNVTSLNNSVGCNALFVSRK